MMTGKRWLDRSRYACPRPPFGESGYCQTTTCSGVVSNFPGVDQAKPQYIVFHLNRHDPPALEGFIKKPAMTVLCATLTTRFLQH